MVGSGVVAWCPGAALLMAAGGWLGAAVGDDKVAGVVARASGRCGWRAAQVAAGSAAGGAASGSARGGAGAWTQ
ncbi:unnamed protein product [Miscanthus lutarioriparius]|uniref:Uncharacterized protein n=1 Tax=Miscanthus lutarioriparius TaxID=422564 RepID=A0A811S8W6_9POAL|nr:unnamed protein product [Miscanthus lutarioriparius]